MDRECATRQKSVCGPVFIGLCSLVVVLGSLWTADPDVFWHLKVGEWLVSHRAVPRVDVYSWSQYGHPWTAHQWGWEAVIYGLYRYLGIYGLYLLVFCAAVAVGWFISKGLEARRVPGEVAAVAGGMGVLLLMGWMRPWPQAGVYALFAVYLWLSLRDRWGTGEALAAAGTGLVWANLHSTAVMLPLLLAAEALWAMFSGREHWRGRWVAAAAAGLSTLVNPHGAGLWLYAVREGLLTRQYRAAVYEWMPYDFGSYGMVAAFVVCVVILFVAVRQGREKDLEFVRAAGFWLLALMSRIYMPYAVLSTAALLGVLGLNLGPGSFKRVFGVTALLSAFLLGYVLMARGFPAGLEAVAKRDGYPVKAVEFVRARGYQRVFNDYGWGGYLIWAGLPVYIDGRADVYRDILKDYLHLVRGRKPVGQAIRETGAGAVLTAAGGEIDAALKESRWWREVYRDHTAVVYERGQACNFAI